MHATQPPAIPVELLLAAYRSGIFPMADSREDDEVYWVEPHERGILPLDNFACSRSLAKAVRHDRFEVTCDTDFAAVIAACAAPRPGHPDSWISRRIADSYLALHRAGHAHSLECRLDGELVGGLYGVAIDRAFCGESMFSAARDASKVALAWLVALLRRAGFVLLDCQFLTDHLASLGAVAITRETYRDKLAGATASTPDMSLPQAYSSLLSEAATRSSSPGKLIAQSLTQTS